jgi:hypothetical protein
MTDTPDSAADPFAGPGAEPPTSSRARLGAGGIIAIVVAGVLVAGAVIAGSLIVAARSDEPEATGPTRSADPTRSPSSTPVAERELSATGEVPFADGRWALYIPRSWRESPAEDAVVSSLPDGIDVIGIWQVTDSPNDLAFVGTLPAADATDEQFEATATTSSRGLAVIAKDTSTREPEWSTTLGGYRQVTVITVGLLADGTSATQVGSVVVLGDTAIYIVATSFEPHFGAPGAVTTIANSIE